MATSDDFKTDEFALIKHLCPPLNALGLHRRHHMRSRPSISLSKKHNAQITHSRHVLDRLLRKPCVYHVHTFTHTPTRVLLESLLQFFYLTVQISWRDTGLCEDLTSWRHVKRYFGPSTATSPHHFCGPFGESADHLRLISVLQSRNLILSGQRFWKLCGNQTFGVTSRFNTKWPCSPADAITSLQDLDAR